MSYKKKVYKIKNGKMTVEQKTCHPKGLPSHIEFLAPYWHMAFSNVLKYQKQRNLQEVHKLVDTSRVKKGLELFRKGHISEIVVTTENQGDVNAIVLSEDKKKNYRVVMKNFLPEEGKPPQFNHEREQFISDFLVTCSCDDHIINRYSSNVSTLCKHCCSVIFFLQEKFDMPKIFITPEERITGYAKSDIEEIETDIRVLPLVKFRRFLNILLMRNFRGMKNALGISIHTVNNLTDKEDYKPMWLTMTGTKEVKQLIHGLVVVLNKMTDKEERYVLNVLKPKTKNSVFIESFMRNGKTVRGFYRRRRKVMK